ncbi:hypothetical protein Pan44_25480 [Caulifigura coniformis]|uniref:Uncharacterized protein n=1 Tax=Caulifigura coniformis TaxID=2527983 RepID=A0A517SEG6_9PLAN|nr:hypothetical protein [Caulifigura coniformis]QDT54515.1 hypothetical protein Pan44_25480 [Caulifigura coniformis]
MSGQKTLAILIMAVGAGWLMTVQNVLPGVDWVWTLGLLAVGILAFLVSRGIDRFSVVAGPLFVLASLLSTLRQTGRLSLDTEVPLLVIASGFLLFISSWVRTPGWMVLEPEASVAPPATRLNS